MSTKSINLNQSEENHADLAGEEAVQKIRELVEEAQTCFFCTVARVEGSTGVRPMSVQQVDDDGNLWFLSASDSHKNLELEQDATVDLYFQGSAHSDFLHLKGVATVSEDREKIAELWEPMSQTWFTGGIDDPRITVIRVVPSEGYYWDNKHGNAIAALKIVVGAMLHKTMDDSIEGRLDVAAAGEG